MNSVETLVTEKVFSFSGLTQTVGLAIQEQISKIERRGTEWIKNLAPSYMKSQQEIEADFWMERRKELLISDETRNNRDGYLNINLERIDSGFMEENY